MALIPSHYTRHGLDLDTETIVKRRNGNDRTGRPDSADPFRINPVEDRPVVDIRDVDANLNEFVDRACCRCQGGCDIGQCLTRLCLETLVRKSATIGRYRQLPGYEDQATCPYGMAIVPAGRCQSMRRIVIDVTSH